MTARKSSDAQNNSARVAGMAIFAATLIAGGANTAYCLSPSLPVIPNETFNVGNYGAVGDGSTTDTAAIQDAINAASAAGGGTVLIPDSSSGVYLAGALNLASNINLDIASGATLRMLPEATYYATVSHTGTPFLTVRSADNVEISGGGTIDGNGSSGWWANYKTLNRPDLIKLNSDTTVEIQGVTIQNSPKEHLTFDDTNNVTINNITISAPSNSPNTDGIDPSGSNYLIENSNISDGDDDIAVKAGGVAVSNIMVNNLTIGSGHGLSIGGQTNAGVNGMTVSNVTFNGTSNGLRMKAGAGNGGLVQNVSYSNITMTNVGKPISISSFYENGSDNFPSDPTAVTAATLTSSTPLWKNISFNGITATGATQDGLIYGEPLTSAGAPATNFDGLTMNNVNIVGYQGMGIYYVQNLALNSTDTFSAWQPGGSNLSLYGDTAAVPEPAPLTLILLGGLGTALVVSRQRCCAVNNPRLRPRRGLR
jgi:polygalacturonase